jgi:GDP-L-fucose synthase
MEKSSKLFIAGHNGLAGSALVRKLREKGFDNLLLKPRSELDLTNQHAVEVFFAGENERSNNPRHLGGVLQSHSERPASRRVRYR